MRVILADDSVLLREGLARILSDIGFEVTAQARNGTELVYLVRADPPDLVVTDLRMPPGLADEGIVAAATIRSFAPQVGILLLSQYVEVHHALRLMEDFDGGVGYLLKDRVSDLGAFAVDLRRVAAGEVVIDPELVRRLVGRKRERDPLDALTERERDTLALMARGLSNAGIAERLHLSPKTVEGNTASIFTKLGLAPEASANRRVLAVLQFLRGT